MLVAHIVQYAHSYLLNVRPRLQGICTSLLLASRREGQCRVLPHIPPGVRRVKDISYPPAREMTVLS